MVSMEFRSNETLSCSIPHKGEGDKMSKGGRMDFGYLFLEINCTPHLRVLFYLFILKAMSRPEMRFLKPGVETLHRL
jgi:hypothetical protein